MKIYGLIIVSGIIASCVDRFATKSNKKSILLSVTIYSLIFYYFISLVRTISGNGNDFLSFSFYGKGVRGYFKATILIIVVYAIHNALHRIKGEVYDSYVERWAGIFVVIVSLYTVIVGQQKLIVTTIVGVASLALALIGKRFENVSDFKISIKDKYISFGAVLFTFSLLFFIVGPSELYAYNSSDFIYTYSDFILLLVIGSLLFIMVSTIIISNLVSDRCFAVTLSIIFTYCILTYIQSMFLNGRLNEIDGSVQEWSITTKTYNIVIWLLIIAILLVLFKKIKAEKIVNLCKGVSIILGLVQLVTFVFLLFTIGKSDEKTKQILWEDKLTISQNNNAIIFILDAYDVQMMDKVLENDSTYLEPLHDFVYFNNMESVYTATDGSLPYLLTGKGEEDGDFYTDTHFLQDIVSRGYDINILTDGKYVEELEEGIISNYSDDWYCDLDLEKTMDVFSGTMRYKGMPYILKDYFKYESFYFTNVIADTNIYVMGTDDVFDDMVIDDGLDESCNNNALRIYHLYGAHAPYFMDENGDLDYDANDPIAQWKGCLKIVYDYIEELKKVDKYNDSTIIIMADHGINRSQRSALDNLGIAYDKDKSNPIFFIKRSYQSGDELSIDSKKVSHRQFFDTFMQAIDPTWTNQYSGTVWE